MTWSKGGTRQEARIKGRERRTERRKKEELLREGKLRERERKKNRDN